MPIGLPVLDCGMVLEEAMWEFSLLGLVGVCVFGLDGSVPVLDEVVDECKVVVDTVEFDESFPKRESVIF